MRAVLTFHSVDRTGSVLSVTPEQLRSLVRGIRESGHAVVSLRALMAQPGGTDQVALTFDDGFATVSEEALPVLRDEGATATVFVTTGHVGGTNDWPTQPDWAPRWPMMTWDQLGRLGEAGWEIQAHTVGHPDLRVLDDDAVRGELSGADDEIERRMGTRPDHFAYPYGALDDRIAALARERYAVHVTTELAPLDGRGEDDLRASGVPRLDTYYLREPRWHRAFGSIRFRSWVAARRMIRRFRNA